MSNWIQFLHLNKIVSLLVKILSLNEKRIAHKRIYSREIHSRTIFCWADLMIWDFWAIASLPFSALTYMLIPFSPSSLYLNAYLLCGLLGFKRIAFFVLKKVFNSVLRWDWLKVSFFGFYLTHLQCLVWSVSHFD